VPGGPSEFQTTKKFMAETTSATPPANRGWLDSIIELGQAGVGAYKEYTGAELNKAQADALDRQKKAPNWPLIIGVGVGVVVLIFGLVALVRSR
jgi:hypothetical protein